jgi:positive regulator of sigma E activity
MAQYEGLVASLATDGKAEVMIRPGTPGIIGAPELTGKVCHCASDGSAVTIEAMNRVGAGVGDVVSISRTSGRPMRNAVLLFGVPLLGGISGLVAGVILAGSLGDVVITAVVATLLGLLLGIIVGVSAYKRVSDESQFMVTKIIRTRTEMATRPAKGQSAPQGKTVTCDRCSERCL